MLIGEVGAIVANGQTFVVVFDPATYPPAPLTLLKRGFARGVDFKCSVGIDLVRTATRG